jgi:serine phosphatase RsbU (regulator of sigma subunit)
VSRQLVASILTLQSGENALVTVHREGADLQLSLRATQFRMNDRLWTLISLQDIHGELERERMSKELEIARDLQRRLFPANGLSFEGFDVAGVCIPAEEVGGDYYDFLRLEETKLGVVIGDVSGKGVPAAIYMTLTKGVMQAWAARGQSPRVVLDKTNDVMLGTLDKGSFMTMTYAVFDSMEHRCTFARAGHSPPIHYSNASGSIHHIESHGIPLGIRDQATFGSLTDEASVHLERGDLLVFYTDGISEAMNMDREEFGVERLFRSITRHHSGTSHDILTSLQRDVADFVGAMPQHDDMTLVVAKASG